MVRRSVNCAFGLSDVGRVRKGNEDAFVCVEALRLFAVADGMGGHNAGEVASRLAIEAIVEVMTASADGAAGVWPYGLDPALSRDANRLRTAIKVANRRVFDAARDHAEYSGMGTTVVASLVTEDALIVGHVGDSRLYVYADGALLQATADDSWVATILVHELGNDKEALRNHPMRNVLTNVLGAREEVELHLQELPRHPGELLLLCTDGLHGPLEDEAIARVMGSHAELPAMARQLVDTALDEGSRDNVTVVLVACGPGAA